MSPRVTQEDEQKRQRILEAAFEVCQRRGVASARMEEVAALAQVSKGTLYRFFRSKQELFLATIVASYEDGVRAVGEVDVALDPAAALDRILEGLCKILAIIAPRTRVHYQAWGVVANDQEFQQRLHGFLRDFHAQRDREFEQLIRHGQVTGAFRSDVPPDVVAIALGAMFSGFIYRAAFDPDTATSEALRTALDTFLRGVLGVGDGARPHREADNE